jgi:hypothetical protein
MNYKQTVLDIEDFISFELATINRIILENSIPNDILATKKRGNLEGQEEAYSAILSIVKENKKGKK